MLVIGGGATGAGAALDAQLRGLATACIERGDFGGETSGRSTKLIWAGIRYIATATAQLLQPVSDLAMLTLSPYPCPEHPRLLATVPTAA